jgi:diadenosine tetraphosphate (Ap4A) HIT family hydrolase
MRGVYALVLCSPEMDSLEIYRSSFYILSQARDYLVPGYLILEALAPAEHFTELPAAADIDLMAVFRKAKQLLMDLLNPERIYFLRFGESNRHFHFHVVPRTVEIARRHCDPHPVTPGLNGAQIVSWLWCNHQSLGYTEVDLDEFAEKARRHLRKLTP